MHLPFRQSVTMSSNTTMSCIQEVNNSHQEANRSCSEQPFKFYYEYKEFEVYRFLVDNSYFVHTVPAIPLNLLCVIVVAMMKPMNSSCVFMLVLGCTDLACVICRLLYDRIDMASSELLCKYFKYISLVTTVYSNFVLICFTIERAVVTTVPLKTVQICTKRNAVISLTLSLIVCLCLNIIYITDSIIVYRDMNGVRSAVCTLTAFAGITWVKVYSAYHNLVPLILVAVCNAVIIFNIKKAQKRRRGLIYGTSAVAQQSTTRTLLVLSMAFTILHLPFAVFNLLVPDYPTPAEIPLWDQQLMARLLLTGTIAYQLMCLQNAINIFLFYLTSSNFRRALHRMIRPFKNHVTRPLCLKLTCCISRSTHGQALETAESDRVISMSSISTAVTEHEYSQT